MGSEVNKRIYCAEWNENVVAELKSLFPQEDIIKLLLAKAREIRPEETDSFCKYIVVELFMEAATDFAADLPDHIWEVNLEGC